MSPRLIWNSLVPWRRRRRYYFAHVLAELQKQEVDRATWPTVFGVAPAEFADQLAGTAVPRLFVQSLAILAYKVPPPPLVYTYLPAAVTVSLAAAIAFLLLR